MNMESPTGDTQFEAGPAAFESAAYPSDSASTTEAAQGPGEPTGQTSPAQPQAQQNGKSSPQDQKKAAKDQEMANMTKRHAAKAARDPNDKSKRKEIDDKDNTEVRETEARAVPRDFALRVATKITAICEREMDDSLSSGRVADLLYRNMHDPDMHMHFMDVVNILLSNEDTEKYAATAWASLIWHEETHGEYRDMLESLIKSMADGHLINSRPGVEHEDTGKWFSAFAVNMGEVFVQMMKISSDLYDLITDIYTLIIRLEMARDFNKKDDDDKKKRNQPKKKEEKRNFNPKKLYDDIIDFISLKGDFRSDNLNQKNPNEFIIVLADRMRSTRRYVIQDIMNRQSLEKKKQLEKELREREASAEEVIIAAKPFNHGLYLYWVEKRYNFKYLAVEKVRITLQVIGFLMGLVSVGASYLQALPLSLVEGLLITAQMMVYSKLFCSKFFFIAFYPKDVTANLEEEVGVFTPIFRKMSPEQMTSFVNKQIRSPENNLLLHLMPEYFKYIFAVMPDRGNILMNKEELNEVMERLELNISKFQRGSGKKD